MYVDLVYKKIPELKLNIFAYVNSCNLWSKTIRKYKLLFEYRSILVLGQLNLKWNLALNVENTEHNANGDCHKVSLTNMEVINIYIGSRY